MTRLRSGVFVAAVVCVGAGCSSKTDSTAFTIQAAPATINNVDGLSQIIAEAITSAGKPGTGTVTLSADAGTFLGATSVASLTLDATGHATAIYSCPACAGRVTLTGTWNALQSQATVNVTSVVDAGSGTNACQGATSNVLYFNGDATDLIHPGILLLTPPVDTFGVQRPTGVGTNAFQFNVNDPQNDLWTVDFSAASNAPLTIGSYAGATGFPITGTAPGLSISGGGNSCTTLTGSFVVSQLDYIPPLQPASVKAFTASFVQYCNGGTAALNGCIHFQQTVVTGDGGVVGAAANIIYASSPTTLPEIGIQSSGRNTSTPVFFKVIDTNLNGVPNVGVSFSVSGPTGAQVIDAGTTGSDGVVETILSSGDETGIATVTATVGAPPSDGGTGITASSPGTPIVGGTPSDQGFSLDCLEVNVSANSTATPPRPDVTTTCTATLSDRFHNPIGIPTPVEWYAEAGSVSSPSISTVQGVATTIFSANGKWPPADTQPLTSLGEQSNPTTDYRWSGTGLNPRDMLVTLIAVTPGEETFFDGSGTSAGVKNGKWDPGEWFVDVSEPYIDENDNQQWDPGEFFIDGPRLNCATGIVEPPNGKWDPPNGCWDSNILLWHPIHILYSGDVSRMVLTPSGPFSVPQSPADLRIRFNLFDDFFVRLSPDAVALGGNLIGPRGSVTVTPDADINSARSYGFNINYGNVQVTENTPGVFTVNGPCDSTLPFTGSTTLPIKTRCTQQYSFSNFSLNQGTNGYIDLVGASPPGPSGALIQLHSASKYTADLFEFGATFQ